MLTDCEKPLQKEIGKTTSEGQNLSVPQQLREVNKLFGLIIDRLQDCALEWQAKVSSKQWKISDTDSISCKSWEKSVLARRFFTEKVLDDEFQVLLSCSGTFAQLLNNFIDLLENRSTVGEGNSMKTNQITHEPSSKSYTESTLRNRWANVDILSNIKFIHNNPNDMKNSLANLFEAKINFDAKFLKFEHLINHTSPHLLHQPMCICRTCFNVEKSQCIPKQSITCTRDQNKLIRNIRTKRLKRSTRTLTKKGNKSKSINTGIK